MGTCTKPVGRIVIFFQTKVFKRSPKKTQAGNVGKSGTSEVVDGSSWGKETRSELPTRKTHGELITELLPPDHVLPNSISAPQDPLQSF